MCRKQHGKIMLASIVQLHNINHYTLSMSKHMSSSDSVNTDRPWVKQSACLIVLQWRQLMVTSDDIRHVTLISRLAYRLFSMHGRQVTCTFWFSSRPWISLCSCPLRREYLGLNSLANWSFRSSTTALWVVLLQLHYIQAVLRLLC